MPGATQACEEVEGMAQLIMMEARTSLANASRIMGKLIAVSFVGFILASNCCFSLSFVPVGVIILSVAVGWLDAIGNECSCNRFFPCRMVNSVAAYVFRWQWISFWVCTIFALNTLHSCLASGGEHLIQLSFYDRLWNVCVMAVVPLALMLAGRTLEPSGFVRVRADIQKAEKLVRQLAAVRRAVDFSTLAPLIEPELVPFYKLGSVAKLLYDFVVSHDATDKLNVNLAQPQRSKRQLVLVLAAYIGNPFWSWQQLFSIVYSPFLTIGNDLLLWESRDLVLYIVAALYTALVYAGSFYFPFAPLCIVLPFMGPKSRSGRYVRALQENIRLAQGASAEQKEGVMPTWMPQDGLRINWPMLVYLGAMHVTALYALVVLLAFRGVCPLFGNGSAVKLETVIMAAVLHICSALGISAGAHRLWAHRSFKASTPLRVLLMIFNSIANQGTIFHWARDHRLHHMHSNTVADPYDANRGFWFSHVGWLVLKKNAAVIEAGEKVDMSDLSSDSIAMFQQVADPFWNLMWCFSLPAFCALLWGDSLWHGFLIAGVLRYVFVLNAAWAVNSAVHAWGSRPYNPSHLTTETGLVSLIAMGEGWQNWHHAFPWDYAAAELGALLQFNPTKIFIDGMAFLGLAWGRKRALKVWAQRKARWEMSQGRPVLESLEGPPLFTNRVVTFGLVSHNVDNAVEMNSLEQPAQTKSRGTSSSFQSFVSKNRVRSFPPAPYKGEESAEAKAKDDDSDNDGSARSACSEQAPDARARPSTSVLGSKASGACSEQAAEVRARPSRSVYSVCGASAATKNMASTARHCAQKQLNWPAGRARHRVALLADPATSSDDDSCSIISHISSNPISSSTAADAPPPLSHSCAPKSHNASDIELARLDERYASDTDIKRLGERLRSIERKVELNTCPADASIDDQRLSERLNSIERKIDLHTCQVDALIGDQRLDPVIEHQALPLCRDQADCVDKSDSTSEIDCDTLDRLAVLEKVFCLVDFEAIEAAAHIIKKEDVTINRNAPCRHLETVSEDAGTHSSDSRSDINCEVHHRLAVLEKVFVLMDFMAVEENALLILKARKALSRSEPESGSSDWKSIESESAEAKLGERNAPTECISDMYELTFNTAGEEDEEQAVSEKQ